MMATSPAPRRLDVWLDAQKIGELREQGNLWAFEYLCGLHPAGAEKIGKGV